MKQGKNKIKVTAMAAIFIVIVIISLVAGIRYMDESLLVSNEYLAIDIAELVKNNFQITDNEVAYMKSLTFNEMEVDAINQRLMDVGNGAELNANVMNVYLVAPLEEKEIKYYVDATNAESYGCPIGTPLDVIWLLNGRIENGKFVVAQRDDINRYTNITEEYKKGFAEKKSFGTFSSDQWGDFITGYAPVYTVEGNYVGMLGIDMDPDYYQLSVKNMIGILLIAVGVIILSLTMLFLYIYFKYEKSMEARLYFDFYSRMSHDMRTPMNGILGMVHLAQTEENPQELHEYFRKVGESGEYLLRLINDTLDVSRISSGKMVLSPETVRWNTLMDNIVDMTRVSAEKKKISFQVAYNNLEEIEYVCVDVMRFKQVLINLLSNAVKYTLPEGTIKFVITCLARENDILHMCFLIQDNGVGMSDEYVRKSLFKPFSQEHNTMTDSYTGSGLGLSITKSIIELMNGTITVKSKIKEGTIFTVKLDLLRKEKAENKLSQEKKKIDRNDYHKLEGIHILLCEDHPLNAEIAKKLLEKKGCLVEIAENGKQGVEFFTKSAEKAYDVILMDIRMPIMDGLEATEKIRRQERSDAQTIPIIAMTANAYAIDQDNARKAGMNAHLSKPINPEELYETILYYISCI